MSHRIKALGSQHWALAALGYQRYSLACACGSATSLSLAACGCHQLRECDGSGGGVSIVSYLVDECRDFIGGGGEGGGGNVLFLQFAIYRGKVR